MTGHSEEPVPRGRTGVCLRAARVADDEIIHTTMICVKDVLTPEELFSCVAKTTLCALISQQVQSRFASCTKL
jgi:hypothetical protein